MDNFINEDFELRDSGLSNGADSFNSPRHRWYTIKEAFSPRLVENAIRDTKVDRGELVLDPFCGSGTTPLTSSNLGLHGVGIEVNPFLAFVAKTKLINARASVLDAPCEDVIAAAKRGQRSPLETFSTFSRRGGAAKWLFNQSVLRAFEGSWGATKRLPVPTRSLLRLALLGAAMDCCNATRDGKCLRYRGNWEALGFSVRSFVRFFESRVSTIRSDLASRDAVPSHKGDVLVGDSRHQTSRLQNQPFRLCITSPPYLNSFDYSDVYRPELFLGKFINSNHELMTLRLKTIRSHVQAAWSRPATSTFGALYADCISRLAQRSELLWNSRLPLMIQAYFEDMQSILLNLRAIAQARASLWIIVSTSAYAGIEIPVDLIIAEIGRRAGWYLREVGVLRYLRTAGQHWNRWSGAENEKPRLRESVIIFDTQPHPRMRHRPAANA